MEKEEATFLDPDSTTQSVHEMTENVIKEQVLSMFNDLSRAYNGRFDAKGSEIKQMSPSDIITELEVLLNYEKNIVQCNKSTKLKSKDLNFLKSVEVFGVSFKQFHHENKNTKKTIVQYMNNLVSLMKLLKGDLGEHGDFAMPDIDNLMKNKDLMKLAQDVSRDMELQDINPMQIMNGLMSGNLFSDPKITSLMDNIASKLESKVASGELDLSSLNLNFG